MTAVSRSSAASLPVRPGEEPWTDEELGEVRAELADEAAGLRAEIDQAESQIAQRLGESCGKPIGKARLLAFPRATLCVECKQRQERR
jgi:DnaK suppressor protein